MDISGFGIASVAVITVICYLIGMAVKATAIENKWIPIIVGVSGGVLGVVGMLIMADFPATDYLTAVAVGIVSGLASTGVNQIAKQMGQYRGAHSFLEKNPPHTPEEKHQGVPTSPWTPNGTKGEGCGPLPLEALSHRTGDGGIPFGNPSFWGGEDEGA